MEEGQTATPEGVETNKVKDMEDLELGSTLQNKLKLRQKLLKVVHHKTCLEKCLDRDLIPRGLRIQQELYFMDASVNDTTCSNIDTILKKVKGKYAKP